jgi:hypothetical protein
VDAWVWPKLQSLTIPAWSLWLLRFHIALPYFFGGIAKMQPDWLLGEPLGQMLASQQGLPIVGKLLNMPGMSIGLAWFSMFFDLLVVPLIIYQRTRVWACILCILFHLMNSIIFNIHIFPWFMLLATPILFEPDWPRRILGGTALPSTSLAGSPSVLSKKQRVFLIACTAYVLFHCIWPLRHHFYAGDASWNERGHYFSWRMMLRGKSVVLGFAVDDLTTGQIVDGQINRFISKEQEERFGRDPEMILHFAHFLGREYKRVTGHDSRVYALALASLNGRAPELMIDPNRNLLEVPRGFGERDWVMPQREPLRYPYFQEPPARWRDFVEIPELQFLTHKYNRPHADKVPEQLPTDAETDGRKGSTYTLNLHERYQ